MIYPKPQTDDLTTPDQSHVFPAARLILASLAEQGAIPLTPSKAFKRIFVIWAAEALVWPHWTMAGLYSVTKVLKQNDLGRWTCCII